MPLPTALSSIARSGDVRACRRSAAQCRRTCRRGARRGAETKIVPEVALMKMLLATILFSGALHAAPPVRTITAFVNVVPANAEAKLTEAAAFLKDARAAVERRGYTVQTIRVATEAAAAYTAELNGSAALDFFMRLDAVAQKEGFALSIGPLDSSRGKLNADIFRRTKNINASMIIREPGSARAAAELIMELSRQIPDGSQNFRFAATAELAPGSPF